MFVRGVALRLSDPPQIVPDPPADARPIAGIVSPGLIDLQVNGGGGVLFNATPTPEGIAAIRAAHRALGTHAILPTLITDAPEVMEAAADAAGDVLDQGGVGDDELLAAAGLERIDTRPLVPETDLPLGDGPHVQLWPHLHGTDGMFLAMLRKRA